MAAPLMTLMCWTWPRWMLTRSAVAALASPASASVATPVESVLPASRARRFLRIMSM